MLIQQVLEQTAARVPEKLALVAGEQRLTYRELDLAANRLAHALLAGGVERGDRVAIVLENTAAAAIAIFAVWKADGVIMVLHPGTKPERLVLLLRDAEPTALVSDSRHVHAAAGTIAAAPSLRCLIYADEAAAPVALAHTVSWNELRRYPAERPLCRAIDLDLAALIYTSGSTGQPKGVMSAHANMVAATNSVNSYLQNTAADVILNALPLAFGYGLYQLMLAFQAGACVVLERDFAFPARTVALMEREGVTALPAVPTFYALLLKYPELLRRPLPALRYMTNAAAALPVQHIAEIRAALPQVQLFSMYGQTECKRTTYLPPEELDDRPASVGVAIPNTEVYIVDEAGQRVPPGAVGELVVRGRHVMRGYWRAPELTAQRFRPGPLPGETVLFSGDLFRADEDGFLYFVARKDDIIKCGGEKVSPREVENVVCGLEGVAEAVVVPAPDPVLGQAVRLLVVPRSGVALTPREIRVYCARTLQDFMQPKHIEIVGDLPRTPNGKIDKQSLMAAPVA